MSARRLSVVMPVHQAESVLPRALAALAASDLPREAWEFVVVDDASRDRSAALARPMADAVLVLGPTARGPAYARNRGVEAASGEVVLFVDSDVCVQPDVLRRVLERFDRELELVALFGAYDTAPGHPGFLSQYRNLLHHYVHVCGAGEADTFWAGCGAVRRTAFRAVGGFDERRYPRPSIEDIELGYRLRRAGGRIVLDPTLQATHLKHWTWSGMLRTDVAQRGIPWMQLLLEGAPPPGRHGLNTSAAEKVKTAAVALGLLLLLVAGVLRQPVPALAGLALFAGVLLSNLPLLTWFARVRSPAFAARVVPLNLVYYIVTAASGVGGVLAHLRPAPPRPAAEPSVPGA